MLQNPQERSAQSSWRDWAEIEQSWFSTKNPHDKFFKNMMVDRGIRESVLRLVLPEPICAYLDFDLCQRVEGAFVSHRMTHLNCDVLCQIQVEDPSPLYVYVLLEHMSTVEKHLAFRVLKYLERIKDNCMREEEAYLPIVIPAVIYNGRNKKYAKDLRLRDLYPPFLRRFASLVFQSPLKLINVQQQYKDSVPETLGECLLAIMSPDIEQVLGHLSVLEQYLLKMSSGANALNIWSLVDGYLSVARTEAKLTKKMKEIREVLIKEGEGTMPTDEGRPTIAEQAHEAGHKDGHKLGVRETLNQVKSALSRMNIDMEEFKENFLQETKYQS